MGCKLVDIILPVKHWFYIAIPWLLLQLWISCEKCGIQLQWKRNDQNVNDVVDNLVREIHSCYVSRIECRRLAPCVAIQVLSARQSMRLRSRSVSFSSRALTSSHIVLHLSRAIYFPPYLTITYSSNYFWFTLQTLLGCLLFSIPLFCVCYPQGAQDAYIREQVGLKTNKIS